MEGHNGLCSKGFRSCLFSNGTRLSTQPGEDFVHCTQDSHWIANQFDSGSSGIRRVSGFKGKANDSRRQRFSEGRKPMDMAISHLFRNSTSRLNIHKNIVRFLGCCWNKKNTRLLMYDYMSNGSLGSFLHEGSGECSLGWEVKYRIILGAAQGLAYLHHDCVPPIVHRDIKLVDDGDFARSSKTIAGSYGYIAPEYGYSLKIGEKSNVYSYGVVVLEVLTGKQPIDPTIQDGLHIVDWVKKMRDIQVIDKGLLARPECDVQEMMQTLGVALLCVNTMPEDRPTMRDVAAMLSEIRQEREESTKGVENNGCSGSCNNNGGERIDDSSPSSVVQQTAKYLRNSSKSFSASSLMYSSFYYY
ncbi:LRR receptor-like serine/threonine-protein kinase RCH1 [Brassica rapa]|uniref:LRR receptor-like serine/threonine-protein kinase RCH1 n=1 Tax=Brassica campestris TaxID=3711 RepID=UPI00142E3B0C|nr:LRR receptor-like serine/threonine-protein kinase RCH1 [Brassica rapa]XP_048637631.1 LRR receptor-like serine/threonine-protein kinase RGI2 [Brassica napus]